MLITSTKQIAKRRRNTCITETQNIFYWKFMSSIFRFINYLYCWICSKYILHKELTRSAFYFILKLKITLFCLLSFFVTRYTHLLFSYSLQSIVVLICCSRCTRCTQSLYSFAHLLSFVVTRCTTRCRSLSFVLPLLLSFVVVCFTTLVVIRCHSFSFVVTPLYHLLSLDVRTICLSFYKRSF